MSTWLLEPEHISRTKSMVPKRGLTNRANVHTPIDVKTLFKTRCSRIPIDPAILAAIGHCFIAKKEEENYKC